MPVAAAATLPVIAQQAQGGGGSMLMLIAFALLAVMLFLSFRKGKKMQQQQAQMRSTLAPGVEVMTGAGIFGTVVHVGERQLVVELAPGTEITVLKSNVARPANPDEEEFEFDDHPFQEEAADALATENVVTDEELEQMFGSEPEAPTTDTEDPK